MADTPAPPAAANAEAPDNTALMERIDALVGSVSGLVEAQAAANERPAPVPPSPTGAPSFQRFRNLGDFMFNFVKAQQGDEAQRARIQAALATVLPVEAALDETTTALNTGLVPPVYTSEILGGLPVSTPILDRLVRHAPLPATGMSMVKPRWSTLPEGDWISTENTEPASDAVAVGTDTVNVLTWGHAVKASVNLIERGTFGGFAQNYFDQCRISYLSDLEAKVKTELYSAADSIVATDIDDVPETIAQVIEYLVENQRDANGNFRGLAPDFVGLSANQFGRLTQVQGFMQFAPGDASFGTMMGSYAGITILLLPSLNQGDVLAGARAATVVYDDQPMELRATVVNTMSVELGVIANTAIDVEYPDALVKITFGS